MRLLPDIACYKLILSKAGGCQHNSAPGEANDLSFFDAPCISIIRVCFRPITLSNFARKVATVANLNPYRLDYGLFV